MATVRPHSHAISAFWNRRIFCVLVRWFIVAMSKQATEVVKITTDDSASSLQLAKSVEIDVLMIRQLRINK